MARYFIGVAERAYVRAAVGEGVVLFSGGREAPVRNTAPGDKVIFYSPKDAHDGDPLQAFTALGEITGNEVRLKTDWPDHTGFEAHVRDCAYEDVQETPIQPLLEDLDFIEDSKNWGFYLQGGKREISAGDYQRIAGAMLGGS
ncbi:EVE domain-containing protein [Aestuariibius sp. 2305UL40-4]|uniref:EVE domain-containing protein n=1 Tax=Aestuariibius violaceus TaxID=3234132 RepID=UPI00345E7EE4